MSFIYMANFEYKPLPVNKVINNWIGKSRELREMPNANLDKQNARIGLLAALRKYGEPNNVKVLTNEFVDEAGRTRRRAAGLVEQRVRPRQQGVYIDTLVGNPKGDMEEGFGGTTEALANHLKSSYPDYGMQVLANQKQVSDIYARKLGIPADLTEEGYLHTGMIKDIP